MLIEAREMVAKQVDLQTALQEAFESGAAPDVLAALLDRAEGAGLPSSVVQAAKERVQAQAELQEALANGATPEALAELIARAELVGLPSSVVEAAWNALAVKEKELKEMDLQMDQLEEELHAAEEEEKMLAVLETERRQKEREVELRDRTAADKERDAKER